MPRWDMRPLLLDMDNYRVLLSWTRLGKKGGSHLSVAGSGATMSKNSSKTLFEPIFIWSWQVISWQVLNRDCNRQEVTKFKCNQNKYFYVVRQRSRSVSEIMRVNSPDDATVCKENCYKTHEKLLSSVVEFHMQLFYYVTMHDGEFVRPEWVSSGLTSLTLSWTVDMSCLSVPDYLLLIG